MNRRIEMNPLERAEREADLRRRDRSEADPSRGFRSDEEVARGYGKVIAAITEPVVEQWPCRTGCGETIGMTASAIAAARSSVRTLGIKPPPERHEIMLCPTCRERTVERGPAQRALELGGRS